MEFDIDIALISETKLNQKHITSFSNYTLVRTDRPNAKQGGGTAILIKDDLGYSVITHPSSKSNSILEYSIIKISTRDKKHLYIVSLYASQRQHRIQVFIDEIDSIFTSLKLSDPDNYFLLAGDLNARHVDLGDRDTQVHGAALMEWYEANSDDYDCRLIPAYEPTFLPAQTFLDHCIIDNKLKINNLINHKLSTAIYDSDHKA